MDSAAHQRLEDGTACLEAALYYRSLGWSVLPLCPPDHVGIRTVNRTHSKSCQNPGKVPWIVWKEFQDRLPTELLIRDWFAKLPNSNVGMALGPASMVIRIDVEGLAGERILEARCSGDLPETLEFRSGRRDGTGRGLLYAIPPGARLRTTIERAGVKAELRFQARGAQTVLPPSRHVDGGLYVWTPGHAPQERKIALAPAWLVAELAAEKASGESRSRSSEEWEEIFAGADDGQRNSNMTSIIGKLFHGLADLTNSGDVQALWYTAKALNEQNHPPLIEDELRTIFRSIHRAEKDRREREHHDSLNRLVLQQVEESCPQAPSPEAETTNGSTNGHGNGVVTFNPPWQLKVRLSDPIRNFLRSPLWSGRPRVRDKEGFIELPTKDLCHWSRIVHAVAEQANWRIADKLKDWPNILNRLYENAVYEEAPDEAKRPVLVLQFLFEKLREARPLRKDDDGTILWGRGRPELLEDGSLIVKYDWLLGEGRLHPGEFDRVEILSAMEKINMVPRQLGPKNKRCRWWVLPPGGALTLENLILQEVTENGERGERPDNLGRSPTSTLQDNDL